MQSSACFDDAEWGLFGPTQWSVIAAAGESQVNPQAARTALASLCESYWSPLYAYLRARGYSQHDAQDLTQGFFAHLIERKIYMRTDRQKGKFRSFLLASLKHYVADARDRQYALKRGAGRSPIPLSETGTEAVESVLQLRGSTVGPTLGEDWIYERVWAETLVTGALSRVAAGYEEQGKGELYEALKPFLTIGTMPMPTYESLALRLNVGESTLRSHVTRLRARYRAVLREEVGRTVNTEAEIDGELRELLRVLTSAAGS